MNKKIKYGIIAAIVLAIGGLLFWIQQQNEELAKLRAENNSLVGQKELADKTVRSMSSYASKEDIERLIKDSGLNYKLIKSDLKSLDSDIKGVQLLVASSGGYKGDNISSTGSTPVDTPLPTVECPDGNVVECPDKFGYLSNRQELKLKEPFEDSDLPLGVVGFSAAKENPWDVEIYPRKYNLTTVAAVNEDGKSIYYNKFTVESNGQTVTIPIDSANFVEEYPSSKFHFNPRLYMSLDAGVMAAKLNGSSVDSFGEISPNLQVFLLSHGRTKLDTNWTFLGVGAGYEPLNESVNFMLSPVNYNIGKPIPLIENLFLGPSLSIDVKGQIGVYLGLRVGL